MQYQTTNTKGFTLVEILIVISVLTFISLITLGFFVDYKRSQGVTQDVELATSVLYKARNDAISSNGSADYGVRLASSSVILFKGSTYVSTQATNQVFLFTSGSVISNVSLVSGGVDIIFNKLTGETAQSGVFMLTTPDGGVKTITIYPTGLIQ